MEVLATDRSTFSHGLVAPQLMKDRAFVRDCEQCENLLSRSRNQCEQEQWRRSDLVQRLQRCVETRGFQALANANTPSQVPRPLSPKTPCSQMLA